MRNLSTSICVNGTTHDESTDGALYMLGQQLSEEIVYIVLQARHCNPLCSPTGIKGLFSSRTLEFMQYSGAPSATGCELR